MIPNLAILRIQVPERSFWGFPIILPLFLLWIPVLLLAPIALVILAFVCAAANISFFKTVSAAWGLLCALPGTDVRVTVEGRRISVRIL
ncbi:MAG TPA: hypothetical protein VG844_18835 [Terracidiphilus sp.]|jgi:hypothetical protein|nr:hypothetical protein [Terracidiphilus sp.]